MADETPFRSLAVLGLGYMGGSLALAARRAGLVGRVVGHDASAQAASAALAGGVIDEIAPTPERAVAQADEVVLATPVRSLGPLLEAIAPAVRGSALVMDIGSVKASVLAAVASTALGDRFVGCHPLAGAELSGIEAAHADVYAGKPCFVCAGAAVGQGALAAARRFWEALGCPVLAIDAVQHDAFMAAASHLPHVAAFALARALSESAGFLRATIPPSAPPTSLRDTTRVAASSPIVWRDIFLANRDNLLPLVRRMEARLGELRAAIDAQDAAALEALLERARSTRKEVMGP